MRRLFPGLTVVLAVGAHLPVLASTLYVDGSISESGDGRSWEGAFKTIREGISAAHGGDTVIVARGTYRENVHFQGKNIALTSTDPLSPDVVSTTVIDGGCSGPVVRFSGTESGACLLSGFTIRNGWGSDGSGICGGTPDIHTRATIRNNLIVDNTATGKEWRGGGIAYCDGLIESNTITRNEGDYGGGLGSCDGLIQNNFVCGNSAGHGGGACHCDGVIQNNTFCDNSADVSGGAFCGCAATIQNNVISRNSAPSGGGLFGSNEDIRNNLITDNVAEKDGGGISYCQGTAENNTIVGNSAGQDGGALAHCGGTIENCIIWGNKAPTDSQVHESRLPAHSCVQGGAYGEGDIADNPQFVAPDNGDFRLSPSSPCIDAGENLLWALDSTDISGRPRLAYGGRRLNLDMGAFEYYINRAEFIPAAGEIALTWSSRGDRTYSVLYSEDLLTWQLADENVPSEGFETTSWIDDGSKTGLPPSLVPRRFYRILDNP